MPNGLEASGMMTGPDSPKLSADDDVHQPLARHLSSGPNATPGTLLHPVERLEAASFGWATHDRVRLVLAHAAGCLACRSLLARDEEIRRRLALLRDDEPRIDVLEQVMRRVDDEA